MTIIVATTASFGAIARKIRLLLISLALGLLVGACSNGADVTSPYANEALAAPAELAISSPSAPLTRGQFVSLATAIAVGENFDGEEIVLTDDLLRTLATIHIRSTAIIDLFEQDETFDMTLLVDQAEVGVERLIEREEIDPIDEGSAEFRALQYIILADRGSNPLREQTDPETGERLVGDNPFTNSFVFDPNLRRNFDTVSPGFLDQFDDTFAELTADVTVDPALGTWNIETFTVEPPG